MKTVFVLPTIGDYRLDFFRLTLGRLNGDCRVYSGEDYFDSSFVTRIQLPRGLVQLRNRYLFGRRLLWQSGMWEDAIQSELVILLLNPRIISNWLILGLRRGLKRKTILWGHAWPRKGKRSRTEFVRHAFRSLADCIVVYTSTERQELVEKMPAKRVVEAPNSLYSVESRELNAASRTAADLIYVGRLSVDKKPDLLLRAFANAKGFLPERVRLIVVGDGPLRPILDDLAVRLSIASYIELYGHIGEFTVLQELYRRSLASVSPGYVGLSIIQSHWFGVPMIVADREPHAPEIEAAVEGKNCVFFARDSVESLANAIVTMYCQRMYWLGQRPHIASKCAQVYNVERMAKGMFEAIELCR